MKVLVTGANGYIGRRLIASLLDQGHEIFALVRDPSRLNVQKLCSFSSSENPCINVIQGDLLHAKSINNIPDDIDLAFYLVHSMSTQTRDGFESLEAQCARNFVDAMAETSVKQVIYLGGISNADQLSRHLSSRLNVENILAEGHYALTVLRAAIIIGSGSASFEIIRDLVEKLPVMLTPKWLETKCQPVAIKNVIQYLTGVMLNNKAYNKVFDIGGKDILTYREMLAGYAEARGLKRLLIPTPLISPVLSWYWISFITSTNYALARSLVTSLRNEVVVKKNGIEEIVDVEVYGYQEALKRTFFRLEQGNVVSSWKDAFIYLPSETFSQAEVPSYGCVFDRREIEFSREVEEVKDNVWRIGGDRGWYYWDWAWQIRGLLDSFFGGVGLRRGRRDDIQISPGDALDFWRVVKADREEGHLVLFAEMKLPGEAWLEFKIQRNEVTRKYKLVQKATFRPQGLWGRIYWYMLLPAHFFIFGGMARNIINYPAEPAAKPLAHAH